MKGILISGIHHWGFSVRVPRTSAGGDSYIVPPITTILGALSRGFCVDYAVKNNVSCTKEFIDKHIHEVFWVTYGAEEPTLVPYSDILRQERVPYRKSSYRKIESSKDWFGVSAFGKVYGGNSSFKIAIILKDNVEFWTKLGWQIVSLGSKESLVSITDVKVADVLEADEEKFSTIFYTPEECLKEGKEYFDVIEMPVKNVYALSNKPSIGVFSKFLVPRSEPPLIGGKVDVRKSNVNKEICKVFKLLDNYIITFKEGLKKWY